MKQKFMDVIKLINQAGYNSITAKLNKELSLLNKQTYKIAVTGEFKAGKSSLINQIFLKKDLLFTDIMEATAVPVEINYSKNKCLKVIYYNKDVDKVEINNPSDEDIKRYTSASIPDMRTRLAEKTKIVNLYWPAANLEGLTIFDTPGINSINAAVISATYKIIPKSDIVIFVTNTKQLSNIEIEFLSAKVFKTGITRAIVVITYNSNVEDISESMCIKLSDSIKNQLANIGCNNIPVTLFDLSQKNLFEDKIFKQKLEAKYNEDLAQDNKQIVDNVITNLLGEKKLLKSQCVKFKSNENFEKILISHIKDNVYAARMEKAAKVLKTQIQLAIVRCSTELSIINKTKIEQQQMLGEIKVRETEIMLKYEKVSGEFKDEFMKVQIQFIRDADKGIVNISQYYIAGFDRCQGLGEIQSRLKNANILLKKDMEDMFFKCFKNAEQNIKELIKTYEIKSQILLNPWQSEVSSKLNISGGILAKVPPFTILALDIMLFVRFGPFGPLADILIRLIVNYIPLLNKALPAALASSVLKNKIKISLNTQFEKIRANLPHEIEASFAVVRQNILSQWDAYNKEQLNAVKKSLESVLEHPIDKSRQNLLQKVKTKLEAVEIS